MALNLLLSYALFKTANMAAIRERMVCGRMLIDSGAFSAWQSGTPVDVKEYAEFLENWRGAWDYAITLDVIGDAEKTRINTKYLHDRGLPVLPVFTFGAKLADFDAMVRDVGYVCIGGNKALPQADKIRRNAMLQRRAAEQGGGIHALAVGSLDQVRKVRPYSSDSSNISNTYLYGLVRCFDGRTIRHAHLTNRKEMAGIWQHLRAHGIDVAALAKTGRAPSNRNGELMVLTGAMSWAYVAADEYLKRIIPVQAPVKLTDDVNGPHLYSSLANYEFAIAAAKLDSILHSSNAEDMPAVWRVHGRNTHHCRSLVPA